jgi:SEC-C motif-containing protein
MFNIESDIESAIKHFPKLKKVKNKLAVQGEIDIIHPTVGLLESFEVYIQFTKEYPYRFPQVKELSGKIERIPERHINTDDTICLAVRPQEVLLCRYSITLKWFIEAILIPHFAREIYYEEKNEYPFGDYSHREDGLWEYYFEKFGTEDKEWIVMIIEKIVNNKLPNNNEACFCGSTKKYKNCHKTQVDILSLFERSYLKTELAELKTKL